MSGKRALFHLLVCLSIPCTSSQKTDEKILSFEEKLISLVAERLKAILDHRLPLHTRSKMIKDNLWVEIQGAMQYKYSVTLQKKWKGLRDYYFKVKGEMDAYVPSDSSGIRKKVT